MKRLSCFMVMLILSLGFAMASPLAKDQTEVELVLGDSTYYYEIGFSSSSEEPGSHVIDEAYPLVLGEDGKGRDDGALYAYWEITGRDFSVELTSSGLTGTKNKDNTLDFSVNWNGKESNVLLSKDGPYSGKGAVQLQIATAAVSEAAFDSYTGELTLTIRRD